MFVLLFHNLTHFFSSSCFCLSTSIPSTGDVSRQTGQVARERHPGREPPHASGDHYSAIDPLPGRSPRGGGEKTASRLFSQYSYEMQNFPSRVSLKAGSFLFLWRESGVASLRSSIAHWFCPIVCKTQALILQTMACTIVCSRSLLSRCLPPPYPLLPCASRSPPIRDPYGCAFPARPPARPPFPHVTHSHAHLRAREQHERATYTWAGSGKPASSGWPA